jgi:hypothetical protein
MLHKGHAQRVTVNRRTLKRSTCRWNVRDASRLYTMFWTPRVLSAPHSLNDSASLDPPSYTFHSDGDLYELVENNKHIPKRTGAGYTPWRRQ